MLKQAVGLSNDELYDVFQQWYEGDLNSYLIEITRDIFSVATRRPAGTWSIRSSIRLGQRGPASG